MIYENRTFQEKCLQILMALAIAVGIVALCSIQTAAFAENESEKNSIAFENGGVKYVDEHTAHLAYIQGTKAELPTAEYRVKPRFTFASCYADSECKSDVTTQVAATVDGVNIYEDQITAEVDKLRQNYGVTDEESWGEWLAQYGYTPSTIRDYILEDYIEKEVIKKAARDNDVKVESSKVDEYINKIKSNYSGDNEWYDALSSAGYTPESYREHVEEALLEQAVMKRVTSATVPDADTVFEYAKSCGPYFDGAKRSSHILFDSADQETAQSVLDRINAGTLSFEVAAKRYSKDSASAANGGDVGWDVLNEIAREYTNALDTLSAGQVSGLVTSKYGIHIIKCTEVFTAPEEITSVDQLPVAFVDSIKELIQQYKQEDDFAEWLERFKEGITIEKMDMPSGLSYDVDVSKYSD